MGIERSHVFVDSNILIYVTQQCSPLHERAMAALANAAEAGPIRINQIVFAEVSGSFTSAAAVLAWLQDVQIEFAASMPEALFLASQAFLAYREKGGPRLSIVPDLFIGADAVMAGEALLTNDPKRYRTYFPELELITP